MIHCRKKPWDHYRNTHVRNLAWCLFSPSLLTGPYGGHELLPALTLIEHQGWLSGLDDEPEPLLEHMHQCKSPRLGLLFEHYWQFFWKTQRGDALKVPWPEGCDEGQWLRNLQVNHPKTHQTLGEADFIAFEQYPEHLLHCELAVKFYLGYPVTSSNKGTKTQNLWLGPNCIDRLDLKLSQMSEKQLQLLHKPEAQKALPIGWQTLPVESQIILRGQLFYPAHTEDFTPEEITLSQDHLKGYWYYPKDLLASIRETEEVVILEKANWLCTPATQKTAQIIRKPNLINRLQPHLTPLDATLTTGTAKRMFTARPVMLSIGYSCEQKPEAPNYSQEVRQWQERRRAFVVPSHWPDTNAPSLNT